MSRIIDEVDVICQHKADGSIIPLRLRFMNEDGEYQSFPIKGFREAEKRAPIQQKMVSTLVMPPSYLSA